MGCAPSSTGGQQPQLTGAVPPEPVVISNTNNKPELKLLANKTNKPVTLDSPPSNDTKTTNHNPYTNKSNSSGGKIKTFLEEETKTNQQPTSISKETTHTEAFSSSKPTSKPLGSANVLLSNKSSHKGRSSRGGAGESKDSSASSSASAAAVPIITSADGKPVLTAALAAAKMKALEEELSSMEPEFDSESEGEGEETTGGGKKVQKKKKEEPKNQPMATEVKRTGSFVGTSPKASDRPTFERPNSNSATAASRVAAVYPTSPNAQLHNSIRLASKRSMSTHSPPPIAERNDQDDENAEMDANAKQFLEATKELERERLDQERKEKERKEKEKEKKEKEMKEREKREKLMKAQELWKFDNEKFRKANDASQERQQPQQQQRHQFHHPHPPRQPPPDHSFRRDRFDGDSDNSPSPDRNSDRDRNRESTVRAMYDSDRGMGSNSMSDRGGAKDWNSNSSAGYGHQQQQHRAEGNTEIKSTILSRDEEDLLDNILSDADLDI